MIQRNKATTRILKITDVPKQFHNYSCTYQHTRPAWLLPQALQLWWAQRVSQLLKDEDTAQVMIFLIQLGVPSDVQSLECPHPTKRKLLNSTFPAVTMLYKVEKPAV